VRQLTWLGPGRLEWHEVEAPRLDAPGQVLVRPVAVALCDVDRAVLRGRIPLPVPYAFGHEGVGEVVEVGEGVRTLRPGQLVAVPFQISCGSCPACSRGSTGSCGSVPGRSFYGFGALGGPWGGFLSDLVRVPFADHLCVPVPDGVDPLAVASLSDNLPDAWRTVGPGLRAWPGADVLVVAGAAPSIGLYATATARALGAASVVYLDRDPARLAVAERLGARTVDGDPPDRVGEFGVTVDASASARGLGCALRSTAAGGTCTSVGIYTEPTTPVPLAGTYWTGFTFRSGRVDARAVMPHVLDLIVSGALDPRGLGPVVAPWDDAVPAAADSPTKLVLTRS
jgi:alcohol dehydrogenase